MLHRDGKPTPTPSDEAPPQVIRGLSRWDIVVCLLFGVASFLIYNANLRSIPASDTYGARYLPLSIWQNHSIALDPIASLVGEGRTIPTSANSVDSAWWMQKGRGDRLISFYPIVVPLVVAPLYLPAAAYLRAHGWELLLVDHVARIMEKLSASLLAAISVGLLYLLMRRRAGGMTAGLLTLAYAFGTTTWVISSQALWMHGLAELLVVSTLLLLTGPCTGVRAVTAGILCGLIACNRPPDAILAIGLGLYGLWWGGRKAPLFVIAATFPALLTLAYNLLAVGNLIGGYGLTRPTRIAEFMNDNLLGGIAGLLVSPTRGLLVFSPFLLFILLRLPAVLRDKRAPGLTLAIGGAAVVQLVLYGLVDWRQGSSFGPRWLTDMLPILFWMLPPVVAALSATGRMAFGAAAGLAVAIEIVGAFWYTGTSDAAIFAASGPDRMQAAWEIRNAPFIAELRHPRAPGDLFTVLQGNIDRVTVDESTDGQAGRQVEVAGWALSDNHTPASVRLRVDGHATPATSAFFTRPDVVRTLGVASPSGWKVTFPAADLAPGEHTLAALVVPETGGQTRLLKEATFVLPADDEGHRLLAGAARHAAEVLKERQQPDGYWLTDFTRTPQFAQPHPEMDTFLNALMLDMIGPVNAAAGLTEATQHAREFLSSQIEADGLVRYHGRPDAPTIGTLGCAITPDTDDTALVWRVAPSAHKELLPDAIATLNRFRTADGLYRTWLAPPDRYQCLDPGKDPNPADIVIQIHVLMLLAQVDPPAAQAFCSVLQKHAGDDNNWVYYRMTPLVVILRLADAQQLGCPLSPPPERLRPTIAGQDIWVDVVEQLRNLALAGHTDPAGSSATALLRRLAADNFSEIERNPPLLFHNDLTATVPRFYWSKEFGYALWLRLYYESGGAPANLLCGQGNALQRCSGN